MKSPAGPDPDRLFQLFGDLVRIDSEPGMEGRVSAFIKEFCRGLGLAFREDAAGVETGGECGNLVVKVPGTAGPGLPPLFLNAHMDTVAPGKGIMPVDRGDRFESGGATVLGADCKAGISAILAAVESLLAAGDGHRPLELIFTVQEEPGLIGAGHLDMSLVEGAWGVVLDGSGPVGGIVVEAPGQDMVKVTVRGRSAHAGVEPEKGVNAIACAARAVAALRLGRHDEKTTSNIGLISGGLAVNIVPDLAVVQGEVRSLSDERLDAERDAMLEAFRRAADEDGCGLEVEVERSFEHFKLPDEARPVRFLGEAMRLCGVEPVLTTSGGGSDANVFNRAGMEAAVMHIGLAEAHSKEEYILKEDLVTVARIVTSLAHVSAGEGREAQP
jgi:tripeptide aminopeptidase